MSSTKANTTNKDAQRKKDRIISLENFAIRKGQVRALEEFKYRKQRKRVETAKALKEYRKVMKQEGYDAGKGASRKRSLYHNTEQDDTEQDSEQQQQQQQQAGSRKRPKSNPFYKSVQKAEKNKIRAIEQKDAKERRERQRDEKLKERKKRTKMLSKRTKKGQPIIKNMMDNILVKLERQQQQERESR